MDQVSVVGFQISKTFSGGRTWFTGSRWQFRHQPMESGCARCTTSIWSTRPWHSTQLTPRFTCAAWLKYA